MAIQRRPPVEVTVEISGQEILVGTLRVTERREQSMTFEYDRDFLGDSRAYSLDPVLPLGSGVFQPVVGSSIFNAFSDTAPDRWGQNLMRRQEDQRARMAGTTARRLGPADFLLGVRDDLRQGALRFRTAGTHIYFAGGKHGVPSLVNLGRLLAQAERFEDSGYVDADIADLIDAGSSLGGARPKAMVRLAEGHLAIAKFPRSSSDEWDIAAWEMVEHELARRSGIVVAPAQQRDVAGRKIFVVERFDRQGDHRVGFASALTLLQGSDHERRSYTELAEIIKRTSNDPDRDLAQLFRRLVFSILTSNTDDHLRNHGFLRRGTGWDLSPAYDMNPNPRHAGRLTTALDGSTSDADIELARSLGPNFRLGSLRQVDEVISEVEGATRDWRKVAVRYGIGRRELDVMEPAFETEQRSLARRIGVTVGTSGHAPDTSFSKG